MNNELKMSGRVDEWTSGHGRDKTCFASCSEINAGIACLDRANEVEPRPNEGTPYRHCEERSDVAIPNNQCVFGQGLATPSSASLRLLRGACPEQSVGARNDGKGVDEWTSGQGKDKTCFVSCSEINAGIACLDRTNEVEPRPNEENNLLILTCHPYGILLTATIFSTDISSLRDFLSATTVINAGIACLDRTNEVEPRPNDDRAITSELRSERGSVAHFQFSIFNFQLTKGIACLDRANEVEPRPNEDRARAESPKSIAQGNALCNELHLSPSSPERAKSFVNNRLRSEQRYVFNLVNLVNPINHGSDKYSEINAGIACLDRADEVEPRPNEETSSCVSPFSIFNFQFSIIEVFNQTKRWQPKIRKQRVGINLN